MSVIHQLGIGVIFPDAVENARRILQELELNDNARVKVLRFDQRRLTSSEAFRMFEFMNDAMHQISYRGGGFRAEELRKGLDFFIARMKRLEEEDCIIVAFDNSLERTAHLIRLATNDAWKDMKRPEWDFDCSVGRDASPFRSFFPALIWEEIEKAAEMANKG